MLCLLNRFHTVKALAVIGLCTWPMASPAQEGRNTPAISMVEALARPLTERVIATGLIAPREEIQVQPLVEGQPIESLEAEIGDWVKDGEILAKLSTSTLELQKAQALATKATAEATIAQAQAQLIEAQASADEAARVAERTNRLKAQGTATTAAADSANANSVQASARLTVARQALAAAHAQLAVAEAQLSNVELMLARTDVIAPYGGRVSARNATIGAIASAAGAPMFVIERDGTLELRADVSQRDLVHLEPGQTAKLHALGHDEPFGAQVRLVEPVLDPQTRLGRVRIALDESKDLLAGMYVEAEVITAQRDALSLPITAIGRAGNSAQVLRLGPDNRLEAVDVTLGIKDGQWIEILSGLAPQDQVVARAGAFVSAGDLINPIKENTNTDQNKNTQPPAPQD